MNLKSLVVLATLPCAWVIAAFANDSALIRGPYLQSATSESIVVVFRTDGPIEPVVCFGAEASALDQVENAAVVLQIAPELEGKTPKRHFGRLHSAPKNTYQWEVTLSGLAPETRYYYAIYDAETLLAGGDEQHFFKTSPIVGEDRPLLMWVVGDSGTGASDQASVYEAALETLASYGKPLDMYLHVGDMAYRDGKDDEFQQNYFDVYQPTLRNTVAWPAMGNHEGHISSGKTQDGPYYDAYVLPTNGEAGGVASGTEAYYSFDWGRVHFICLDSHDLDRHATGEMAQWLQQDLQQTTADWLVAFWHHPPYTKGSHDSDVEPQLIEMRENIMPILESYGVDIVLTGHSHVYERSMLIDKAYHTPTHNHGVVLDDGDGHRHGDGAYHKSHGLHAHEGVTQIVTGHGGASVSRRGVSPIMRQTIVEHGSVFIEIEGNLLTAHMIDKQGAELDQFSMLKQGKVTPKVVDNPWSPVGPTIHPSGGVFPENGIISMSTEGFWKGGNIHFTLDGTEPDQNSPIYNEPIALPADSKTVTVKAKAYLGDEQPTVSTIAVLKNYGPSVVFANDPITIDGSLDEWAAIDPNPIELGQANLINEDSVPNRGAKDLGATLYRAWNEAGFFIAVDVSDDEFNPATDSHVYNFDGILVMFDGRAPEKQASAKLGLGAYNIFTSHNAEGGDPITLSFDPRFAGYEMSSGKTETGYTMEVFIPFNEASFPDQEFEDNRVVQLAIGVLDLDFIDDKPMRKMLSWGSTVSGKAYRDSSSWMPILLKK